MTGNEIEYREATSSDVPAMAESRANDTVNGPAMPLRLVH